MQTKRVARAAVVLFAAFWSGESQAHHEALFGPQSSLAVESEGFASAQMHVKVIGRGASYDRETVYILSAGVSPWRRIPWSLTVIQPFTYEDAHTPTASSVGPLAACDCFARENVILSSAYRFEFKGLQRAWDNDGNFALLSAALELPTGNKEAEPLHGSFNGIAAGIVGLGWRSLAAVMLGYYRINGSDGGGSKKGNNGLAGLGMTYTPVDTADRLLSVQLGVAAEYHEKDILGRIPIDDSGGWELFASPTLVWSPAAGTRFFTYVSLPFAQDYRSPAQEDRWRAGLGIIYSFASGAP